METELSIDSISKMKVAELKKELKARGLSTSGAKNELQERLQQAIQGVAQDLVSEDGNAESEILDEDEVLGGEEEGGDFDDEEADAVLEDEPKIEPVPVKTAAAVGIKRPAPQATETSQETQPKKRVLVRSMSVGKENGEQEKTNEQKEAEEKKVIKIAGVPVKERLEMRAQKFGVPLTEQAKKEARAARFGVASKTQPSTPIISTQIGPNTKINFVGPSADVLKKRAERFGCNVSKLAAKVGQRTVTLEQQEKLKKRGERFGLTSTSSAVPSASAKITFSTPTTKSSITMSDLEERKKLRAERFKI